MTSPFQPPRIALAIILAASVAVTGCSSTSGQPSAATVRSTTKKHQVSTFDQIPDIVARVAPSTVSIHSDVGEGSGVIWSADGLIVTNEHVTRDASQIVVRFADGTHVAAKLLAEDPMTDLAILRADRTDLPPATFATSLPRVGELAIALGNPLGFSGTVSAGIVSSLNRNIPGSAQTSAALVDLIQTDAAISPGNSGGALVDSKGQVMGINVAYIPPEARAVSIGFAIPAETVTSVVQQLLKNGTVSHAFMGLAPTTLTSQVRDSLNVHATAGAVVTAVTPGGPAADAGIQEGDVLVELADTPITSAETFLAAMRTHKPGDVVNVQVVRGTKRHRMNVTLRDRPST